MNIQFAATCYSASSEDDVRVVGFAEREDAPQQFLILQRADEADEQDEALGHDTYHVELGEPAVSGYGGLDEVLIAADKLVLRFSKETPWCAPVSVVEIAISPALVSVDAVAAALGAIFIDRATITRL